MEKNAPDGWLYTKKFLYDNFNQNFVSPDKLFKLPETFWTQYLLSFGEGLEANKYTHLGGDGFKDEFPCKDSFRSGKGSTKSISGRSYKDIKLTKEERLKLDYEMKKHFFGKAGPKSKSNHGTDKNKSESGKSGLFKEQMKLLQARSKESNIDVDRKTDSEGKFDSKKMKIDASKFSTKNLDNTSDYSRMGVNIVGTDDDIMGFHHFQKQNCLETMPALEGFKQLTCQEIFLEKLRFENFDLHHIHLKDTLEDAFDFTGEPHEKNKARVKTKVQNLLQHDLEKPIAFRTWATMRKRYQNPDLYWSYYAENVAGLDESDTDEVDISSSSDEEFNKCLDVFFESRRLKGCYHKSYYKAEEKYDQKLHELTKFKTKDRQSDRPSKKCLYDFSQSPIDSQCKKKKKVIKEPPIAIIERKKNHDKLKHENIEFSKTLQQKNICKLTEFIIASEHETKSVPKASDDSTQFIPVEEWDDTEYEDPRAKRTFENFESIFEIDRERDSKELSVKDIVPPEAEPIKDDDEELDADIVYQELYDSVFDSEFDLLRSELANAHNPSLKIKPGFKFSCSSFIEQPVSKPSEPNLETVLTDNVQRKLIVHRDFSGVSDKVIKNLEEYGVLYEPYLYDTPNHPLYISYNKIKKKRGESEVASESVSRGESIRLDIADSKPNDAHAKILSSSKINRKKGGSSIKSQKDVFTKRRKSPKNKKLIKDLKDAKSVDSVVKSNVMAIHKSSVMDADKSPSPKENEMKFSRENSWDDSTQIADLNPSLAAYPVGMKRFSVAYDVPISQITRLSDLKQLDVTEQTSKDGKIETLSKKN